MLRKLLGATVAAIAILAMSHGADADSKKYVFALVPKNMNNPFFDQALAGCKKAEQSSTARSSASISVPANMAAARSRCRS
jgi:ribose transport system substrate-binding protein